MGYENCQGNPYTQYKIPEISRGVIVAKPQPDSTKGERAETNLVLAAFSVFCASIDSFVTIGRSMIFWA